MARILVVDDEVGIRELLSEILYDEGHGRTGRKRGASARRALRMRPDLVLLDIWMPDTDGVSLLKEWASQGMLDMPVIMMSGHATIDTAVEATRIGAMDFLESRSRCSACSRPSPPAWRAAARRTRRRRPPIRPSPAPPWPWRTSSTRRP